jgi:predicted nucleic acid-binding protein
VSGGELRTVVVDTSVLINLAILDQIVLLGALEGLRFVVPDEVLAEVKKPEQKRRVRGALQAGTLLKVALDQPAMLDRFARLRKQMKLGEAACLALAAERGWLFACDEGRIVRSEAKRLLGPDRLLNTPGLFLLAIRTGYWTVDEADEAKTELEKNRYQMQFSSFRELLG